MFNLVKFDYFSDSVFRDKQVNNGQKTIPKFLSGFKKFYHKKSCRGIKFLFNWKNSSWFSGAYNDWIGLQDFHALSDLRSTQSEQTSQNFKADVMFRKLKFCHTGICSYCYEQVYLVSRHICLELKSFSQQIAVSKLRGHA